MSYPLPAFQTVRVGDFYTLLRPVPEPVKRETILKRIESACLAGESFDALLSDLQGMDLGADAELFGKIYAESFFLGMKDDVWAKGFAKNTLQWFYSELNPHCLPDAFDILWGK